MYQLQYSWNLLFFHNCRASRPRIDRWRLFDMFAKLALNYRTVITKIKATLFYLLKENEIIRKPEKRIKKLGKKRHFLMLKKAGLWNATLFNLLLQHDWFSCQAVTYLMFYQFFGGHVTRAVLCAIQTTPPTACQGKGRTGSAWNNGCFDFKWKRTLLNCCWFKSQSL